MIATFSAAILDIEMTHWEWRNRGMKEAQDLDDFGVVIVAGQLGLSTYEVTFCDRKTNVHVFKLLIFHFHVVH